MNFHDLMAKMRELDQPAVEQVTSQEPTEACGDMPPAPMAMPTPEKDTQPPSMSINLNAQGMDDISDLMQLLTKVNPDMAPKMPPSISIEPMDKPMSPPPLKMLPDMDGDNDKMPGGELDLDKGDDEVSKAQGDLDNDGDHDMDDHDLEKKDKKDEWANEPDEETKDIDYMVNKLAGGMNKPKQMVKHSYRQGDNPMAFRESIKQELQQRLAEAKAKGVK